MCWFAILMICCVNVLVLLALLFCFLMVSPQPGRIRPIILSAIVLAIVLTAAAMLLPPRSPIIRVRDLHVCR
jgi:hypothetical protein